MEDKKDVIIASFAWSDTLTHICNSRCILGIILTQRVLIYISSVSTFLKTDLWASYWFLHISQNDFQQSPTNGSELVEFRKGERRSSGMMP